MSLDNTINNKRNFYIYDPLKQDYIDSAKLDNLTLTRDSTSRIEIPTTATTWQNAYELTPQVAAASRLVILVPGGQGESFANPKTYYVNAPFLDVSASFDYFTQKRLYSSSDKLLWVGLGALNPVTGYYATEISQTSFARWNLPPFTRIVLYSGLIPDGQPNAGTPRYLLTYYNRWDGLNNSNSIPALNGPTALAPELNPSPLVDQWVSNFFYDIPSQGDPANNIPAYNDTVQGKTKWINLPKNGFM